MSVHRPLRDPIARTTITDMDRRTSTVAASLLLLLAMTVLGGCGRTPVESVTSAGPTPHVAVSLGIYSGRQDPSWTLTDAQAAAVVKAIAALPVTTGTPPEGGLGYHGLSLVMSQTGRDDESLVSYRATVAPPGVGPRPYRSDPGRTVERLLLETGRSTLALAEIAAVEADLAAAP